MSDWSSDLCPSDLSISEAGTTIVNSRFSPSLRFSLTCMEHARSIKGLRSRAGRRGWCGWRDLNPHGFRHWNLNPACLPVPPHPRRALRAPRQEAHCYMTSSAASTAAGRGGRPESALCERFQCRRRGDAATVGIGLVIAVDLAQLVEVVDHDAAGLPQAVRRRVAEPVQPLQACAVGRSEEHTSELQSLMRISDAVFCVKKKNK